MALINCEECGKEISEKAISCPHCGAPVQQPVKTFIQELEEDLKKESERLNKIDEQEQERISKLSEEEKIAEKEKIKLEQEAREKFQVFAIIFIVIIVGFIIQGISKATDRGETPSLQEEVSVQQTTEELLSSQFSSWDGSHPALVERVKTSMKNPDSFEHVETKFGWVDDPKYNPHEVIIVHMRYRGTNSFGGVIPEEVFAHVDTHGNVKGIL